MKIRINRLQRKHFPPEAIQRFRQTFLAAYSAPFGVEPIGGDWYTEKYGYITDQRTESHLLGDVYLGGGSRPWTKAITVDLDAHSGETDVYERADKVCAIFDDVTPLIFTTPRGGLHLWFLLSTMGQTVAARRYVLDRLAGGGLAPRPGYIEVLPAGPNGSLVRLPLGADSLMLNAYGFLPVASNQAGCLEVLDDILVRDKLDRLVIPAEYRTQHHTDLAPARRGREKRSSQYRRTRPVSGWRKEADEFLNFGLQVSGTRNQAFLRLRTLWMSEYGLSADEARRELWKWICANHNGKSNEFPRNEEAVRRHIARVVDSYNPAQAPKRRRGPGLGFGPAREFTDRLDLPDSAKDLLAHFVRACAAGGRLVPGEYVAVEVPSENLRGWDRTYSVPLRVLINKGHVEKGPGYTTYPVAGGRGRCQTYHVKTLPPNLLR